MRITVSFSLKRSKSRADGKCPVYVRCTMNGQRFELSTGIFIIQESWDDGMQKVIGRTEEAKILNNRLDKIGSRVQDVYNQLESKGNPFSVFHVKSRLQGVSDEKGVIEILDNIIKGIEARVGNDYSEGTLKHYKTSRERLAHFFKIKLRKNDFPLSMVDYSFLNSFDLYLKTEHRLKPNTVLTYHKHLKKVLNTAIAMNLLSHNPYSSFKVSRNETHRDYLTIQELEKIKSKEINTLRMEIIRDVFVFACYTGLGYAELIELSHSHIHQGNDGGKWIIIDRNKTNIRCQIPLLPQAKAILGKYGNFPENKNKGKLLPVRSNQKMNEYLKELAEICGIKKKLSMHVARHTFATTVTLANGVPIETVSKMLGHTSLKTTQIYARIVDSKISKDMERLTRVFK
ncbi:site-specific integrase [Sunxiuqinia indica]|uniref:site-specific integrase n=1 Tax=Sunxiuqinia indica TaxID=2692584 RepID=UPI001358D582|nr:site-specific integrase [Sunxiuqinia indica]